MKDLVEEPAAVAGEEEPGEGWACEEGWEEDAREEDEEEEEGTSPRAYCSAFAFNASTPGVHKTNDEKTITTVTH